MTERMAHAMLEVSEVVSEVMNALSSGDHPAIARMRAAGQNARADDLIRQALLIQGIAIGITLGLVDEEAAKLYRDFIEAEIHHNDARQANLANHVAQHLAEATK